MIASFDDLHPGTRVRGVLPGEAVHVVAVERHGDDAVTLTYRTDRGESDHRMLCRFDEDSLDVESAVSPWQFDVPGDLFRLAAEAHRIRLAHLFDPRLGVHLRLLEPLPHQTKPSTASFFLLNH